MGVLLNCNPCERILLIKNTSRADVQTTPDNIRGHSRREFQTQSVCFHSLLIFKVYIIPEYDIETFKMALIKVWIQSPLLLQMLQEIHALDKNVVACDL